MTKKILKLWFVGINFRESVKIFFSRPFNFANWGVIREIREIFWTRNFLTLKYISILSSFSSGLFGNDKTGDSSDDDIFSTKKSKPTPSASPVPEKKVDVSYIFRLQYVHMIPRIFWRGSWLEMKYDQEHVTQPRC